MIKNLQVLRAIAALLVVFFHSGFLSLKIGQFGVDMFFVLSGFIISYVINRGNNEKFLMKRLIRIAPIYYFFTFLTIAVWFFNPGYLNEVIINSHAIINSILFIPYKIDNSGPILSLGWTLNYEMYFYLIVGLFYYLFRKPTITLVFSSLFITLICILNALFGGVWSSYYLSFFGFPIVIEFILGIILYYIFKLDSPYINSEIFKYILSAFAAIGVIMMIYFDHNQIYTYRFIYFGIPSFLIILYGIIQENKISQNGFLYRIFYKLGNASYVIYLCHPFVMSSIFKLFRPIIGNSILSSVFVVLLILFSVGLISYMIHLRVELPMLRFLERYLLKKPINTLR